MKPVNLLPEDVRPKHASGGRGGSAYLLIGGLALVLLAVVVYVLTANSVNSKKSEAAKLSRQADAAQTRVKTLGAFASFEQVKQTREQSVEALATSRFDWERMLRELARILPPGTYLSSLDASAAGGGSSGSGAGGSGSTGATGSASSQSSATGGATGPTLLIKGCTRSQPEVATVLVRLRRLDRATDVTLAQSTKATAGAAGAGSGAPGGPGQQGSSDSSGACAKGVAFDATVQFDSTPPAASAAPGAEVPASLGGGP